MEKEVHAIPAGCDLLYNFLSCRKRSEEAEPYRQRIFDYFKEAELAQQERTNLSVKDDFKHHGVEPDVIRKLHEQLGNHPDVAIAHLVQKVVHHFPQEPSYVLGIIIERFHWFGGDGDEARDQRLIDKLADEVSLPGHAFVIALEDAYKPLRKVFERIEGSEIYRAESYKAKTP